MPKLPSPNKLVSPLRLRGIKGVIFITPLAPLILRGEFLEKLMKSRYSGGKNCLILWILVI